MEEGVVRYKIIFDGDITTDNVNDLIEKIYSYQSVDLYFSTDGGMLFAMEALIDAVNEHPDIKVVLTNTVSSAGTYFLFDCTQPVILGKNLMYLMFHCADIMCNGFIRGELKKKEVEEYILGEAEEVGHKLRKIGLTKTEVNKYLKGEDVYIYPKDFKRLKVCK